MRHQGPQQLFLSLTAEPTSLDEYRYDLRCISWYFKPNEQEQVLRGKGESCAAAGQAIRVLLQWLDMDCSDSIISCIVH